MISFIFLEEGTKVEIPSQIQPSLNLKKMYLTYLDVIIAQGEESNWSETSAFEIYSFNASSAIHLFKGANLKKNKK